MFQFRRFPSYTYGFSIWYHNMTYGGLLHSVIPGSMSAYDSPRHFVVCHDLLRLPMPRHSLCALCSLTIELCFDSLLRNCSHLPNFLNIWLISSFAFTFIVQFSRYLVSQATLSVCCCQTSSFLSLRDTATSCFGFWGISLPQAAPCSSSLSVCCFNIFCCNKLLWFSLSHSANNHLWSFTSFDAICSVAFKATGGHKFRVTRRFYGLYVPF